MSATNTDFRLSVGLFRHPKIIKLRRRLGVAAVLAYVQVLGFTAERRPDGCLCNMDAEDLAIVGEYDGDAAVFVAALVELRLIDRDEDGAYHVHDWHENNPWAAGATARSEKARKAADARWNGKQSGGNAPEPAEECPPHADSEAPPAQLVASQCSEHATGMPQASSGNAPLLSSPYPSPDVSATAGESIHTVVPQGEAQAGEGVPDDATESAEASKSKRRAKEPDPLDVITPRAARWEWLQRIPLRLHPAADWYEALYEAHPIKKSPQQGWAEVLRLTKAGGGKWLDEERMAMIAEAHRLFRETDRQWLEGFPQHLPTWLHGRGWEGEPEPVRVSPVRRPGAVPGGPEPTAPPRRPTVEEARATQRESFRTLVTQGDGF